MKTINEDDILAGALVVTGMMLEILALMWIFC